MIMEYENLVTGDNPGILTVTEPELLGCTDAMNENELREVWEENPELLGFFFRKIAKRVKARRSYRKSLTGLSRGAKRKAMRQYRQRVSKEARAQRRKKGKIAALAFIPGGRIALAIARRRAKRAGMKIGDYMAMKRGERKSARKERRLSRRLKIKGRIMARRERRAARRGVGASQYEEPTTRGRL